MMYTHTITVYNSRTRRLVKSISDAVNLARFGVKGHPGVSRGAPVELAVTPNGKHAYVSNYSMYGAGFGAEGTDDCYQNQFGPSFLYRIDVSKLKIDDAIQVGSVPKYVAVTPDGRFVLVSNWCGYDLSVVSTRLAPAGQEAVARAVPARDRRHPERQDGVHRSHGLDATSPGSNLDTWKVSLALRRRARGRATSLSLRRDAGCTRR